MLKLPSPRTVCVCLSVCLSVCVLSLLYPQLFHNVLALIHSSGGTNSISFVVGTLTTIGLLYFIFCTVWLSTHSSLVTLLGHWHHVLADRDDSLAWEDL
jgi:hypothetical protein